jgi:hypothetical protein
VQNLRISWHYVNLLFTRIPCVLGYYLLTINNLSLALAVWHHAHAMRAKALNQ